TESRCRRSYWLFDPHCFLFSSSRRRHTRFSRDWSSDVCSSDLASHGREPVFTIDGTRVLERIRARKFRERRREVQRSLRAAAFRSEERRVGKEGRARCSTAQQ